MSEKKGDLKNASIDLDLLEKIDALNERFFKTMENLKEARPCLQGCDEAFISVAQNLLSSYDLLYGLYNQKYRGAIEYETALLRAKNDKTVPFSWRTKWLKKYRQNTAADLVDFESDEYAKEFFADRTDEIVAQYITKEPPRDPNASEEGGEWEIVEEPQEGTDGKTAETVKESPQNAQKSAKGAESGKESVPAEKPAEGAKNASGNAPATTAEEPKKKRARRQKEHESAKGVESGQEPVSVDKPAEDAKNASESVSKGMAEEPKKKRARRKKEQKGEKENVCEGDQAG